MSAALSIRMFDPNDLPPGPQTLEEIARECLVYLEMRVAAGNLSPGAVVRERQGIMQCITWTDPADPSGEPMGKYPKTYLRQEQFDHYLLHNLNRWPSGNTRRDRIQAVLGMLRWAKRRGYIEYIPWDKPPEISYYADPKPPMRPEHYFAIRNQAKPSKTDKRHRGNQALRLGMHFTYVTGARPKEMRELEPHHIDWTKWTIVLQKHKTRHKTKRERIFGFGPSLARILRVLVARMKPGQKYIFLTERGKPWTKDHWNRTLKRYAKPAGVPDYITAYCTRHGFGFERKLAGEDSKDIADQMGHVDTRMLEKVYAAATRFEADHLAGVAARAERKRRKMPNAKETMPAADKAELARQREAEQFPLFEGLDQ